MPHIVYLLLYLAAAVCFLLATFNAPTRKNLVAAGLFFWVLVPLIHAVLAMR